MKSVVSRIVVALAVLAAVLGLAACGSGGSSSSSSSSTSEEGSSSSTASGGGEEAASTEPIMIGAAIDESNVAKVVDVPALDAAKLEAEKINKEGGVDGREIEIKSGDTQLEPNKTKAVAEELVAGGAEILWVTCDVDWATPSIQVGLKANLLTVAPCIGTDQMGPKRFGSEGELAFSFGNLAQDEGAAMAKLVTEHGWKTVNMVYDQAIVFTQNDCEAFKTRFEEEGGEVVLEEPYTSGDHTINSVINHVNASKADAIVPCSIVPELSTFVAGVRSAGNETPIVGPWPLDGTYWLPKNTKYDNNIWFVTYGSIYGDDPDPEVNELVKQMSASGEEPSTSAFITGAAAIDGIKAAIEENNGSTEGKALAESMQKFNGLKTISGEVSFSPELHTVYGRPYRVMEIKEGKPHFVELIEAGTPAEL
jgi:branched-chain amino acid transport system substrate-binding protein